MKIASWKKRRARGETYFFQVFTRVLLDLVGGVPGVAIYHGVKSSLVKGNVDRLVLDAYHVAYVHILPFYPFYILVAFRHEVDDHGRKINT